MENKKSMYNKKYYEKTKEERLKNKIICDICGGRYVYYNKSTHLKTNKHQLKLLKIENEKLSYLCK